jgi:hypothetical protein
VRAQGFGGVERSCRVLAILQSTTLTLVSRSSRFEPSATITLNV